MTRNKLTYTSFFTTNTFFPTLHIIQTHYQHLCRETRPRLSVLEAQKKACRSTKKQQRSGGLRQKMTWFRLLPSFKPNPFMFLCVFSFHPTLEPSLTSIPSLPILFPPKPYFQHKHHRPTRVKNVGRPSTSFFVPVFLLFLWF